MIEWRFSHLFLGLEGLTLDDLMRDHLRACGNGAFVCMICGKRMSTQIRRHMRNQHLTSGTDYHCPPCDKFFKNRANIYNHIRVCHKDWHGVNYDDFSVKR